MGDAIDVKPIRTALNEITAWSKIFSNTNINDDREAYTDCIK